MMRVSAKYGVSKSGSAKQAHAGGSVIERPTPTNNTKWVLDLTEGFLKNARLRKETKNSRDFTVKLTHAAHDVHGLREHGAEADGFTTAQTVTRSVSLQFDTVADANKAFNAIISMDDNGLKQAMVSETLEDTLAEQLGLETANEKHMRMPSFQVALFPPHFVAS